MSAEELGFVSGRGLPRRNVASAPSLRPQPRICHEVAAVCYRIRGGIEFLLVRTRNGRWTFPKGGVESHLTRAQTAALEAYEEAGVHGRIEQIPFVRYARRKRGGKRSYGDNVLVEAYLCEVLRLEAPEEPGRNPTWFSAEKAKRRLRESRASGDHAQFAHVIERAVARIQRLCSLANQANASSKDALQKAPFEAADASSAYRSMFEDIGASFVCYVRRQRGRASSSLTTVSAQIADDHLPGGAPRPSRNPRLGKVLQLAPRRD